MSISFLAYYEQKHRGGSFISLSRFHQFFQRENTRLLFKRTNQAFTT